MVNIYLTQNAVIIDAEMTIKLVCPKCGFVIETFQEEELQDRRKMKRFEALKKRQSLCLNCKSMVMGLKEVRE